MRAQQNLSGGARRISERGWAARAITGELLPAAAGRHHEAGCRCQAGIFTRSAQCAHALSASSGHPGGDGGRGAKWPARSGAIEAAP
jgi:hypothetical protein